MKEIFYNLPINFSKLKEKNQELPTCNLNKSIAQNIFLMITSNINSWKDNVQKSILQTLLFHELRLTEIRVDIEVNEEEITIEHKNVVAIKKRLEIWVNAITKKTGEPFVFNTKLFISPLSLD